MNMPFWRMEHVERRQRLHGSTFYPEKDDSQGLGLFEVKHGRRYA